VELARGPPEGLGFLYSALVKLWYGRQPRLGKLLRRKLVSRRPCPPQGFERAKATSLDLGTVGFIAENIDPDLTTHLRGRGFRSMREEEYHAVLDELCNPHLEQPSLLKAQISLDSRFQRTSAPMAWRSPNGCWIHFRHLYQIRFLAGGGDSAGESVNYSVLLAGVESHDAATEIIFNAIVKKLCKLLNIEPRDVGPSKPLPAFGIDAFMAIELRSWCLRRWGRRLLYSKCWKEAACGHLLLWWRREATLSNPWRRRSERRLISRNLGGKKGNKKSFPRRN
jgi:hypothetical protein